jgi:hypothetical protein
MERRIVVGRLRSDKSDHVPQVSLEDNVYTRRVLDTLYNPRHLPVPILSGRVYLAEHGRVTEWE